MKLKTLTSSAIVVFLSFTNLYATEATDDPFKDTILAGTVAKARGSLNVDNINSDERIERVLRSSFRAGDQEHNWRELLEKVPNPDETLNIWGYDVFAVNHALAGKNESSSALNVLRGRHGMDRVGDAVDNATEEVKKGAKKATEVVEGMFS